MSRVFGIDLEYYVGSRKSDQLMLKRLSLAFARSAQKMQELGSVVFPRMIRVLEVTLEKQFNARGHGQNMGRWASLSKAYAEWKKRRYPGKGILEATGALREALTNSGSPHAERSYTASMLNYGTRNVQHASYHQTGTARMKARPPLDFTKVFEKRMRVALREAVREAVRGATDVGAEWRN